MVVETVMVTVPVMAQLDCINVTFSFWGGACEMMTSSFRTVTM